MSKAQISQVKEWHKSIFDWELEHPGEEVKVCAVHFNVSASWISTIRNSDIYIEYATLRRQEHNSLVSKSVIDAVSGVASVALGVLEERINDERDKINLSLVNDTAEMALKALGFGGHASGRGEGGTNVNIVLGGATPELLERARGKMRTVNAHMEPDYVGAQAAPESGDADAEQSPKALPAPS